MPIPLLVPVLAALSLAVAADEEEEKEEPGWTVDIGENDLRLVSESEPGYIDINLQDRRISAGILTYYRRADDREGEDGILRIKLGQAYRGGEVAELLRSRDMIELFEEKRRAYLAGERFWDEVDSILSNFYEDEPGKFVSPQEFIRGEVEGDSTMGEETLIFIKNDGRQYFRWRGAGTLAVGGEDEEDDAVRQLLYTCVGREFGLVRGWKWEWRTRDRKDQGLGVDVVDDDEAIEFRRVLGLPTWGFEIRLEPLADNDEYWPVNEDALAELIQRLDLEEVEPPEGWNRAYRAWFPEVTTDPPLKWA